jgi:hypothetical protein
MSNKQKNTKMKSNSIKIPSILNFLFSLGSFICLHIYYLYSYCICVIIIVLLKHTVRLIQLDMIKIVPKNAKKI